MYLLYILACLSYDPVVYCFDIYCILTCTSLTIDQQEVCVLSPCAVCSDVESVDICMIKMITDILLASSCDKPIQARSS